MCCLYGQSCKRGENIRNRWSQIKTHTHTVNIWMHFTRTGQSSVHISGMYAFLPSNRWTNRPLPYKKSANVSEMLYFSCRESWQISASAGAVKPFLAFPSRSESNCKVASNTLLLVGCQNPPFVVESFCFNLYMISWRRICYSLMLSKQDGLDWMNDHSVVKTSLEAI